jgi:hypothetical protein
MALSRALLVDPLRAAARFAPSTAHTRPSLPN